MSKRPNVLLMIADDHRYQAIRATGDPTVQTPVFDQLIADGVCLDRNYHFGGLIGGVCVPTRASLMTGANPFRAIATRDLNDRPRLQTIRPGMATLPRTLRDAGYFTYHVGKWHNDKRSLTDGFCDGAKVFLRGMSDHWHVPVQDFDPTGEYPKETIYEGEAFSTIMFGNAAMRFLREYEREEPFFLYCAFTAPHDPRVPPPEYAALYDPEAIPLPPSYLPEHPFDNGEMRNRDESLAPFPRTPEIVCGHIADYYGMISHLDAYVGRILDTLAETGHGENTLVIYTGDHGLAVGQHGLMGKQNCYEHSLRVPVLIRGPLGQTGGDAMIPRGRRVNALTHTGDLFPTICDFAGLETPDTVECQSLLPLLDGSQDRLRDYAGSVYKDVQRSVVEDRWKLIRYYCAANPSTGTPGTDRLQLFDLAEDPWELNDLSADPSCASHVERLASEMESWRTWADDPMAGTPILP